MLWPKNLNKRIKANFKLAELTSFKVGGAARFFFEAKSVQELQEVLILARRADIPVFILGAGSNILVSDAGLDGLVIKLSGRLFKRIKRKGNFLEAGAGVKLNQLMLYARNSGLCGLEFLAGIPGTLGGALAGNAGARERSLWALVKDVCVLDYGGKPRRFLAKQLKFAYRKSNLNKYIILSARIKLRKANKHAVGLRIREYLLLRSKTQKDALPNAGCIFKNPAGNTAGKLVDACGLKGKIKGGAIISKSHANFILNKDKASSKDILSLMDLMQRKVRKRFKVELEPEIKIWM